MTRHADWLARVRLSGLVVSEPILEQRWSGGVAAVSAGDQAWFRSRYQRWCAAEEAGNERGARAWIDYLLSGLCGLDAGRWWKAAEVPDRCSVYLEEYGQALKPDWVLRRGDDPVLLLSIVPLGQHLDRRDRRPGRWRANPAAKLERLLRATGVELGLLTNGEAWRFVYAPTGQTSGSITWTARGFAQEKPTLAAFTTLLHRDSVLAEVDDQRLLALCRRSRDRQGEVADQLGLQVREGLEQLLLAWDEADHAAEGRPLRGMSDDAVYEMALVVMMRFVFLLYAEEKALLPHGEVLYDQGYGLSWLWHRLAEQHRESPASMPHSSDAWLRFLATSRLVHGGCAHQDLALPSYGGRLFDPTRYPALERAELSVSNATLYDVLRRLLFARQRRGAELQRVGYWELDVEQIGYVYEGLLDHRCARAGAQPVIKLRGAGEAALAITELEKRNGDALVQFVAKESGKKPERVERGLAEPDAKDLATLRARVSKSVADRVAPYAGVVQVDEVVEPKRRYLTTGTSRRETGTQYTPQSLTAPVVEGALEPLSYVCEEDKPGLLLTPRRVRPPRELLALKVCDPAMGSGAFLVQVVRYLADRLVESWEQEILAADEGAKLCLPYAEPVRDEDADEPLPLLLDDADADRKGDVRERAKVEAMRLVAEHCVYGVDINPLAVEMAKLSLWLVTLAKNRPFTFVDHALKCGDSLLGLDADQVRTWSFDGKGEDVPLLNYLTTKPLKQALALRQELQKITDTAHPEDKARLHAKAEEAIDQARWLANNQISAWFMGDTDSERRKKLDWLREQTRRLLLLDRDDEEQELEAEDLTSQLGDEVLGALGGRRPFHWFLEFPEVLVDRGGFDAVVGNPPFVGGQKITGALGRAYREWLVERLAGGQRGSADLVAYFFLRMPGLLDRVGVLGFVATNTAVEGASLDVGIRQVLDQGWEICRGTSPRRWPGGASILYVSVHLARGWAGARRLDGTAVDEVPPTLKHGAQFDGEPYRLAANRGGSFQGSNVVEIDAFTVTTDEREELLASDQDAERVLRPFMGGIDLNRSPTQHPSRLVIDFRGWPLRRESGGSWSIMSETDRVAALRTGVVPTDYPGEVAGDWPAVCSLLERRAKPARATNKRDVYRERWWQFGERREELYEAVDGREYVAATVLHTEHWCPSAVPADRLFSHGLAVFPTLSLAGFACLASSVHEVWARLRAGSLETRLRYNTTRCFDTFPFPLGGPSANDGTLQQLGAGLHETRMSCLARLGKGMTVLYNLFHDPTCADDDIQRLRDLHVDLDSAVLDAYRRHAGWESLDLGHCWQKSIRTKTKKNRKTGRTEEVEVVTHRFTISDAAREEVLRRLLKLNHERYAEEVKQGLHDKKKGAKKKRSTAKAKPKAPSRPKTPRARLPAAIRDSVFARGGAHQVALWFKPGHRSGWTDTYADLLKLAATTVPWASFAKSEHPWILMHAGTVMDWDASAAAFGPGDVEGVVFTLPKGHDEAAQELREALRKAKVPGTVAATCPAPSPARVTFGPWAILGAGPVSLKFAADGGAHWPETLDLPVVYMDEDEESDLRQWLDDGREAVDARVAQKLREVFARTPRRPPPVPVGRNLPLFGGDAS